LKSNCHTAAAAFVTAIFALGSVQRGMAAPVDADYVAPTPDEGDTLKLFAGDQETYDSNLFRVPAGLAAFTTLVGPNQSREDHLNVATAGADGQWIYGRQTITLKVRGDSNRFERNTDLNNTAVDARPAWIWQIGDKLSGQAWYEYDRALGAFADTRYFARDIVESNQTFANARYQIGPRFALYGSAAGAHTTNSAAPERLNDFDSRSSSLGIEYATAVSNTFSGEYDRTVGRFPSDLLVGDALIDRNYTENTVRVLTRYGVSDKTTINASAGYLKRDYPEAAVGSFSGDIWRVSLQWLSTDKLQLTFSVWHELQAYLDSQSNYFVTQGGSVAPVWTLSEKLALSAAVSFENQNYISSSLNVLTLGSRRDKLDSEQVAVKYNPIRALTLKLKYRYEKRNSNQAAFSYDDNLASAGVMFTF
jgi:exopolysaccharide biosynthesis operon protein EpsL